MPKTTRQTTTMRHVYLDHAAGTPIDAVVLSAMLPWMQREFANPSPLYRHAVQARRAIDQARNKAASALGTQSDTIIFTASGTESTNMAIMGVAAAYHARTKKTGHIITTAIEHHAVLEPIRALERQGWRVTYLPVDACGRVSERDVQKVLRKDTVLTSIMYANNEIGTIEPIADIGRTILKWRKQTRGAYPYFHTDACQAAGSLDLFVDPLHVDLMTVNGSKIYGPKGIGLLYCRRGVPLAPLIYGGGQESGRRSGTENVAAIVGFGSAIGLIEKKIAFVMSSGRMKNSKSKIEGVRNYFWKKIQEAIPDVVLNGPPLTASGERLPNNLSVTFTGATAEALILYLDHYGIECSSGSACTTNTDDVSHVLLACGRTRDDAMSTIRFTLGRQTTKKDIAYVMKYLPKIVAEARRVRGLENS